MQARSAVTLVVDPPRFRCVRDRQPRVHFLFHQRKKVVWRSLPSCDGKPFWFCFRVECQIDCGGARDTVESLLLTSRRFESCEPSICYLFGSALTLFV